jgi:signal transduction histidine kinase
MKIKNQKEAISVGGIFSRGALFLYKLLLKPKYSNEDIKRREFILNILLTCSISFAILVNIIILFNSIKWGVDFDSRGCPFAYSLIILLLFSECLFLSRNGKIFFSTCVLLSLYFLPAAYISYNWGDNVPQSLLVFALIIVMAGILVDTVFAFLTTIFISFFIFALGILQSNKIIDPNFYWQKEPIEITAVVGYIITLIVILVVSWLSNREIENSLKRARKSETELKKEKDLLELRVQERVRELEKTQAEKISQMSRFIEFGEISAGIFHDLINHISSLFFDVEKASGEKRLAQTKEYLKQADEDKAAIVEYIELAKKQFQNQNMESLFSVEKEIQGVIGILRYKFTTEKIKVNFKNNSDIFTYGNAFRFNHVICNIILNALDAYRTNEGGKREICVNADKEGEGAIISIEDFAGGIREDIREKIFEPFFTTKSNNGSGIGLINAKNVIEEDFNGTIYFQSVWGKGTKFIIKFPIKNEPK